MIITIRIRTPYPRRLTGLLRFIHRWLRQNPAGVMMGWSTEDEVGDEK